MKAWYWLRALAIVLAIFTLGHTLGTAAPKVRRGPQEAALFAEMQGFRFPIMGFQRSYWDFYRGFALVISILLIAMAVLAWQLSAISKNNPRQAFPPAVTLLVACLGLAAISWIFFFSMPMILAASALVCSGVAVGLLASSSRNIIG